MTSNNLLLCFYGRPLQNTIDAQKTFAPITVAHLRDDNSSTAGGVYEATFADDDARMQLFFAGFEENKVAGQFPSGFYLSAYFDLFVGRSGEFEAKFVAHDLVDQSGAVYAICTVAADAIGRSFPVSVGSFEFGLSSFCVFGVGGVSTSSTTG